MGIRVAAYGDESLHRRVGEIIRAHSSNREDIRLVASRSIDLSAVRTILDVGCGYGWFENSLDGRFETIVGIDALEENRNPFLSVAQARAEDAIFKCISLPAPLPFPSGTFDLIIAAYSLYFFPELLAEVKRVLTPVGTFVAITHSQGMLEEGEEFFRFNNLRGLIERFSAENGEAKLKSYFSRVKYIDYANSLVFDCTSGEDLALYIAFKAEFISRDVAPDRVAETLMAELRKRGTLSFNKNDRIFLSRK